MSNQEYYNIKQLKIMNSGSIWRNHIILPDNDNESILYKLCATGDADLNGRYYVALRKNTNIRDPRIIRYYNLF
jgi:hypothetical protein